MGKYPTYPLLIDEALCISITDLKSLGYFKTKFKTGLINWRRGGKITATVSVSVNLIDVERLMIISYSKNGVNQEYKVTLLPTTSNLGFGVIWYFLCPIVKKRCRKLFLLGDYFVNMNYMKSPMYECQTYSKSYRSLKKSFDIMFSKEQAYEEINSKHFKKFYNGKPTKRYLRLLRKIE
jgi:hypothetical protein